MILRMPNPLCFLLAGVLLTASSTVIAENDLTLLSQYVDEGVTAALIMRNVVSGKTSRINAKQCEERLSPCSTFKILNCAIAFEEGILSDENSIMKWDGKLHPLKAWNRDLSVREAIACSAVPHFQSLATMIGSLRMARYLKTVGYGNADISSGLTTFWLDGSLLISANEQAIFLEKLYTGQCPEFSDKTLRSVKAATKAVVTDKGILYGKTGTMVRGKQRLGWFVGFVEPRDGDACAFALNLKGGSRTTGPHAKELLIRILKTQGTL